MFTSLKLHIAAIATVGIITTATITAPFTYMFGKHYDSKKDFSCCKQDKLVFHHYYSVNVFWIEVSEGYTEENTGKPSPGGCNIICND